VATLSRSDFDEIARLVCPHCAAGDLARRRESSGEWVHSTMRTVGTGGAFTHGLCWANRLRNSAYAPAADPEKPPPKAA
jgi:hypothetical protein